VGQRRDFKFGTQVGRKVPAYGLQTVPERLLLTSRDPFLNLGAPSIS